MSALPRPTASRQKRPIAIGCYGCLLFTQIRTSLTPGARQLCAMKRHVRGSELQEEIFAPLRLSIATMATLMLTNFYAERGYRNKGKPKKALLREW